MLNRPICQKGIDLLKASEGCNLEAYPDPATGGKPWTIGYGHTGKEVIPGLKISQIKADTLLKEDLINIGNYITLATKFTLNDNQFAALCCLVYNIGTGNYIQSTLLKYLNKGQLVEAGNEFLKWNKAAGKVLKGLSTRRQNELNLFKS